MTLTIQQILFIVIALVVLISAVMVVTTRNLFHAALFLVLSFFGVAGFYVLLEAGFFAAVQVLVYIGAISILFIFAVMLTRDVITSARGNSQWSAAAVVAAAIFIVAAILLGPAALTVAGREFGNVQWTDANGPAAASATVIGDLGRGLVSFTQYAVPFLLGAVMLLVAMVGAIWVARERRSHDAADDAGEIGSDLEQPVQEALPLADQAAAGETH